MLSIDSLFNNALNISREQRENDCIKSWIVAPEPSILSSNIRDGITVNWVNESSSVSKIRTICIVDIDNIDLFSANQTKGIQLTNVGINISYNKMLKKYLMTLLADINELLPSDDFIKEELYLYRYNKIDVLDVSLGHADKCVIDIDRIFVKTYDFNVTKFSVELEGI